MVNSQHLTILKQGTNAWNRWRSNNPTIQPDLQMANLFESNLSGTNLSGANLRLANLFRADLRGVNLSRANLFSANLFGADLSGEANLKGANFQATNLSGANFSKADLTGANLSGAILVKANLTDAVLTNCSVYGIAAWDVELKGTDQKDLVVTPPNEPILTADNIEVAQFIYLMLNNPKIRDVIDTIGQKVVLILGSFSDERKPVLDALRDKLRTINYLPIVFDFKHPTQRDFSETIMTLAGLCRFIIADITNPRSSPLELQATVPNYMIPFVPIIQEGEKPFGMFQDLQRKYDWVLEPLVYDTPSNLINVLEKAIVEPALVRHKELMAKKVARLSTRHVKDYS